MIFELWSNFWSDFVFLGLEEAGIVWTLTRSPETRKYNNMKLEKWRFNKLAVEKI